MIDIKVGDDLWATVMLPEGIVERWMVADGSHVCVGDPVVEVRIEGAFHEITAPATGHLTISVSVNDVIEPGSVLGQVGP